jgi:hypothetical protein
MGISDSSTIPLLIPYIPLAFLFRTSITICLCSAFHLRFSLSPRMTDSIYSLISSICPFSSCRETDRKLKRVQSHFDVHLGSASNAYPHIRKL